jgi:hypothetical protein
MNDLLLERREKTLYIKCTPRRYSDVKGDVSKQQENDYAAGNVFIQRIYQRSGYSGSEPPISRRR